MNLPILLLDSQIFSIISTFTVANLQPFQINLRARIEVACTSYFSGSKLQKDDTSSKYLIENVLQILWLQFSVQGASLYIQIGLAPCTDGPYIIFYTVDYQYVKWYYTTRKWYFNILSKACFIRNFAAIIITIMYIMANKNKTQRASLYQQPYT